MANSRWLFECLQILQTSDQGSIANNGLNHTIADESTVWIIEKLKKEAKNKKLDWMQVYDKKIIYLFFLSKYITTIPKQSMNHMTPIFFFS